MHKGVTFRAYFAIFNRILIVALWFDLGSCSQHKNEGMISKSQERVMLSEEMDDEILEQEVSNTRDLTKSLLDIDQVNSLKLKEIYQHEEPLAICFVDQNQNLILFEAINWSEKEINFVFENAKLQHDFLIKAENINSMKVRYYFDTNTTQNKCFAIYDFGVGEVKLRMEISSKDDIDGLFKKYTKLVKSRR